MKLPYQNLRLPRFQTIEWLDTQNVSFAVYHSTCYITGRSPRSPVQSTGDLNSAPKYVPLRDERGEGRIRHGVVILKLGRDKRSCVFYGPFWQTRLHLQQRGAHGDFTWKTVSPSCRRAGAPVEED